MNYSIYVFSIVLRNYVGDHLELCVLVDRTSSPDGAQVLSVVLVWMPVLHYLYALRDPTQLFCLMHKHRVSLSLPVHIHEFIHALLTPFTNRIDRFGRTIQYV